MKHELLDLICCPACHHSLTLVEGERKEPECWEGSLTCVHCQSVYPVQGGMPYLYVNNEAWQPKAVEAEGWVKLHQQLGIYEVLPDAVDLKVPYFSEEPWIGVARSFDMALEQLQLKGTETILDLGAGRGWAAKQFALRGCQVVALDVVTDENIGLGRARGLMDAAQTYFDRVIGDGENLPFFPESFDLVFCAAALHHSANLPLLLQNISRVLKPGGRLCAINEPCRSVVDKEAPLLAKSAGQELAVGIIETRPDLLAYEAGARSAGLKVITVSSPPAYRMDEASLRVWAGTLGAIRPYLRQRPLDQQMKGWLRFIYRRILATVGGHHIPRVDQIPGNRRRQIETAVLLWTSGELFLMAEKPA